MKMIAVVMLAGIALVIAGCTTPQPTPKPTIPIGRQWDDAVRDDDPLRSFMKTWHLQLTSNISLEVKSTYKPWLGQDAGCDTWCEFTFTMKQGDDPKKWVEFDCDAVADKIIQSDLVPLAQRGCILLRKEALQYWVNHSDPDEFTDSYGRIWKLQGSGER